MKKYNPKKIEKKWQDKWLKEKVFKASEKSKKKKHYQLETFPYPSAQGLHVGHPKGYIAEDIHARYMRMLGYEVLYTIGWDAFGLPTENYAIKVGKNPKEVAKDNIKNFKRQLQMFGFSYDWDREINTASPEYYKWTQWLFIKLFERGLAYRKKAKVNWCENCKTVIANEQVINGECERCNSSVRQKEMEQWFLKITDYADRLLEDLDGLDWPEATIKRQKDWIGKSEGAEIEFPINSSFLSGKVVFASNNKGKLHRMQKLFKAAGLDIVLKTPKEIGIDNFDVIEDGSTLRENAEKKARALSDKTKLPIFADDTGFFIDGVEIDPVAVKRNALSGEDEKSFTVEEIAKKMQQYYQNIASSRGGKVDSEWRNAMCLVTPDKSIMHIEVVRPTILTDEMHGVVDPHLPLRGLYISKATGKYVLEQTEKEEMEELKPITDGLRELFAPTIKVFTTRPDTLFGATYIVLAPEYPLVAKLLKIKNQKLKIKNIEEVENYIKKSKSKTELMRQEEAQNKTGVELKGIKAINPATKKEIPIWIADYVLSSYGTGAIMAVPAHDERDFEFAKKFKLPIRKVILPEPLAITPRNAEDIAAGASDSLRVRADVWTETGEIVNSGKFDGMNSEKAKWKITDFVKGKRKVQYKIRDWSVSRQRYWGAPIPLVFCGACREKLKGISNSEFPISKQRHRKFSKGELLNPGWMPVPDDELPVTLPDLKDYRPKGMPPLQASEKFINVKCPKCGEKARRSPETLDTFVDSSWYYLAYVMQGISNFQFPISSYKKAINYWLPVDLYVIGAEHTVLHLLYSRFITKFLYDEGYLDFAAKGGSASDGKEPFLKIRHVGLIKGEDGQKMSKSRGNVVNPDALIKEFGADSLRMFEMFMGPFGESQPWDPRGVTGMERFLRRVWAKAQTRGFTRTGRGLRRKAFNKNDREFEHLLHKTIRKVTEDIQGFRFNTAISALMVLLNEAEKPKAEIDPPRFFFEVFLKLLHPFAPHITQELWSKFGNDSFITYEKWPEYDEKLAQGKTYELVIQINGRLRDTVSVKPDISKQEAEKLVLQRERIKKALGNSKLKKAIFVKGRLINLVTEI